MTGVALAALALLAIGLLALALAGNRVPLTDPPGPAARLRIYLRTHVAETSSRPLLPELRTRRFRATGAALLAEVAAACRALGWEQVRLDPGAGAVRCVVVTPLFGFRDDLEARAVEQSGGSAALALRSASRVGRGDLGANARHVLDLYAELEPLREMP